MSNVSFILVYVEDVAASAGFYEFDSRARSDRILADLRHAARRAGPDARAVATRRRQACRSLRPRGRDSLHCRERGGSRRDARPLDCARRRHCAGADCDGLRLHLRRTRSQRAASTGVRAQRELIGSILEAASSAASSYSPSKSAVERYRSAKEGMMVTIIFLAFSGRRPISIAAATAAPEEMPTGMPSSRATSLAVSKAV